MSTPQLLDTVRRLERAMPPNLRAGDVVMQAVGRRFATEWVTAIRAGTEGPDSLMFAVFALGQAGGDGVMRGFLAAVQDIVKGGQP